MFNPTRLFTKKYMARKNETAKAEVCLDGHHSRVQRILATALSYVILNVLTLLTIYALAYAN